MKLSDYVIEFMAQRGTTHVFGMSGGAAVHLFDSASKHPHIDYVCSQHEQSAAMSADGYARVSGKMGVAITTSGPGATNLLTGTCCSFFDSIPTLMITGQVSTHRLKRKHKIRQLGFQETDVLSIFKSVTKFATQLERADDIRRSLEEAWYWAFEGRPGSVLIDLPDDLQRAEVKPDEMLGFTPPALTENLIDFDIIIERLNSLITQSLRPVIILGGGLSTPRIDGDLGKLLNMLDIPVLQTWAGIDLLEYDHPLRVGPFGVYGPRVGNFTVQNSDLLICLGTRLSQNVTGGLLETFARNARIVMIDADSGELDKFDGRGINVYLRVKAKLQEFVTRWVQTISHPLKINIQSWNDQIVHWQKSLPNETQSNEQGATQKIKPYDFVKKLSNFIAKNEVVFADTGGNLTWTCNGIEIKDGQRLISAWNNTPMGYSLPAAIGASVLDKQRPVTCIIGDGGLMICLAELATLPHYSLPIKVIVFDNQGHAIQKQTLETWLNGNYVAVDPSSGLSFPPIAATARAMGLSVIEINTADEIIPRLSDVYSMDGPILCNVKIDPEQRLFPVLKFGSALEDQLPVLGPGILEGEMLIPTIKKKYNTRNGTPGI